MLFRSRQAYEIANCLVGNAMKDITSSINFGDMTSDEIAVVAYNQTTEHYEGVVYWYGIDSPALVRTDMLNVCDKNSIKKHNYVSPTAQEHYQLISRYELGIDTGKNSERFFPDKQDTVRIMKGTSTFKVDITKDNLGVMLRRKFDYSYQNQTAKVYITQASSD